MERQPSEVEVEGGGSLLLRCAEGSLAVVGEVVEPDTAKGQGWSVIGVRAGCWADSSRMGK